MCKNVIKIWFMAFLVKSSKNWSVLNLLRAALFSCSRQILFEFILFKHFYKNMILLIKVNSALRQVPRRPFLLAPTYQIIKPIPWVRHNFFRFNSDTEKCEGLTDQNRLVQERKKWEIWNRPRTKNNLKFSDRTRSPPGPPEFRTRLDQDEDILKISDRFEPLLESMPLGLIYSKALTIVPRKWSRNFFEWSRTKLNKFSKTNNILQNI